MRRIWIPVEIGTNMITECHNDIISFQSIYMMTRVAEYSRQSRVIRRNRQMILGLLFDRGLIRLRQVKSAAWWDIVVPNMNNARFKRFFRISMETFKLLVRVLYPEGRRGRGRKGHKAELKCAIGLMRLATVQTAVLIAETFGVSTGTIVRVTEDFVSRVLEKLQTDYIQFPTEPVRSNLSRRCVSLQCAYSMFCRELTCIVLQEMSKLADQFLAKGNINGVILAMDGTHIPIPPPAGMRRAAQIAFINRKGFTSLNVLAACDAQRNFRFVEVKYHGAANDKRMQRNCAIAQSFESKAPVIPERYHVVADAGFTLESWCVTSYVRNHVLTEAEERFNTTLSQMRVVIEQAFGILKGRWRRLRNMDCDFKHCKRWIMACFVLHNVCQANHDDGSMFEHKEDTDDDDDSDNGSDEEAETSADHDATGLNETGNQKRQRLTRDLRAE